MTGSIPLFFPSPGLHVGGSTLLPLVVLLPSPEFHVLFHSISFPGRVVRYLSFDLEKGGNSGLQKGQNENKFHKQKKLGQYDVISEPSVHRLHLFFFPLFLHIWFISRHGRGLENEIDGHVLAIYIMTIAVGTALTMTI